jgi:predicted CXXCH cytochrome family protein
MHLLLQEKRMEKPIILMLTIILIVGVSAHVMAQEAENFGRGIKYSPHNFSHPSWMPLARTCNVCHIFHNESEASQRYPAGLRWKGDVSSISYIMYHSFWGAAFSDYRDRKSWSSITGRQSNLPDGLSKICLACHDGIIAPDVFVLHHFVSSQYNEAKTHLRDPETTIMGESGMISEVLDGGKIQCSSCHDVHGEESVTGTKLLRVAKRKICMTCHSVDLEGMIFE